MNECGIVPDTAVECSGLVTDAEIEALIGPSPTLTEGQGCEWETSTNGGVDSNTLGVDVYASPEPYEGYVDRHELSEQAPGLGDAAVTTSGFETAGTSRSCGRTVVVLAGERTVLVALCLGDEDVAVDRLRPIADQVLARL